TDLRRSARHPGRPFYFVARSGGWGTLSGDRYPAVHQPSDFENCNARATRESAKAARGAVAVSRFAGSDPIGRLRGGDESKAGRGDPMAAGDHRISETGRAQLLSAARNTGEAGKAG